MTLPPARIERILETALYCDDLARSRAFYVEILGGRVLLDTPRLVAIDIGGASVLLLFQRGASDADAPTPGGVVPGHGGTGIQHLAFAIRSDAELAWRARLDAARVALESVVDWPPGGRSLYVRDPDGHSVELVTPGLWAIY